MTNRSRTLCVPVLVAVLASVAACGDDSHGGGAAADAAPEAAADATAASGETSDLAAFEAELETYYEGTYELPPASAPPATPGKDVWLISCGQAAAPCALTMSAMKAAGDVLGWNTKLFDGKGDPNLYIDGIRQAITAGADAILLYSIDCALIKAELERADEAGIPVVAAESIDCNEAEPGSPALFDWVVTYAGDDIMAEFLVKWGGAQAVWNIVKTGGQAKVIDFRFSEFQSTVRTSDAFQAKLAECASCELVEVVDVLYSDLGPGLQQKAEQALLRHPDATGVEVSLDAAMTSGVLAALQGSGRLDGMHIMGAEGNAANLDLIREDRGQDACVGVPTEWEGWAAADALNRIFNDEAPVSSGIGVQICDREHNMPASGPFVPMQDGEPIDFVALYTEAFSQ